jgi:methyl-accepting chemotaxis protein
MSISLKMLVAIVCSQLFITLVSIKLGESFLGLGICLCISISSLIIIFYLIKSTLIKPLDQVCATIQTVRMEGNLALRSASHQTTGKIARTFNELLDNFQSIIGKVIFNSNQVASSAQSLKNMAHKVAEGSQSQHNAAQAAGQAIEQMTSSIQHIADGANQAAENAGNSRELSSEGAIKAQLAASEIERIAQAFEDTAVTINHLGEKTHLINGIASAIAEIADQTNLLALNAAIEAARAGESGRGFAVVADEVRKLAERTSLATKEISSVISSIQIETADAITKVKSGTALAHEGTGLARSVAETLTHINQSSLLVLDKSNSIASAIAQQTVASELVGKKIYNILELVDSNSITVQEVLGQATHLDGLSENLKEIETVFKLGESGLKGLEIHRQTPPVVQAAAREIEKILENAITTNRISEADLFDEKYERIPNVEPPKYHTRFDKLTDELFPKVQETLLDQHPEFVYAGAVDRNGYFPTHNKKFSAPLTGDQKKDMLFSRSKRIFADPVGKRCGNHNLLFLLQTYRRDTGEVMHDVSAPIIVRGKQWGGFRIGYKA